MADLEELQKHMSDQGYTQFSDREISEPGKSQLEELLAEVRNVAAP